MGHDTTAGTGARLASLVRRLTEFAETEAGARAALTSAVAQLLDTPFGHDLQALLLTVTTVCPALDGGAFLAREGERFGVRATLGLAFPDGPLEASPGGLLALAASSGRAVVTSEPTLLAGGPFPDGTRAACALPLLDTGGACLGVALFSTRTDHELGPEGILVARAGAERAARALEISQLSARLASAQEQSRRASGFRDQVLAIVGHDLRNPLGAVVMSAALLQKKGGLTGWQARTVDRVRSSALRMGRIIDDLLSYTRTRLGDGIPISRRPADLGALTQRVVEELRAAHPQALFEISAEGDLCGEWDSDRLEQVISNLFSNALDHGADTQPIAVALRGEPGEVQVEVVNEGEMPEQVLQHAFEAFHKGPERTGKKASGLGLGLYIAREIVRRHGGEITICSQDGSTRISTRLPRTGPAAPDRSAGEPAPT